jgi:tRNA pseudouridine55 synthase
MYSALKHQGQPLYKLARLGLEIERAARPITIHRLELLQLLPEALQLRTLCTSGTYVRTLGEQVAAALGTCGYLAALRRDFVEPFADEILWTLEQLEAGLLPASLIPADRAVPQLARLDLSAAAALSLQQGRVLSPGDAAGSAGAGDPAFPLPGGASGLLRLYGADGAFFGLGERLSDGQVRGRRLYATASSAPRASI